MTVRRYDAATLDKAEITPSGFLRAPAVLTRVGVFEYRRADGSVRRELRLPEEVFRPDSIASIGMAPITDDHPAAGFVTPANAKALTVGHLGEDVRRDGDLLRAVALITDGEAIAKVKAGRQQLSLGYVCNLDEAPGEWNGQRYDAIQREIVVNHCALVDRARAGPVASLKLDAADAVCVDPDRSIRADRQQDPGRDDTREPSKETQMTVKLKLDGIEIEVANDQAAQLITRAIDTRDQRADAADKLAKESKANAEKATARADEAEAKAKKLEQERSDAADPKTVATLVASRVALVTRAREVLGAEAKLDELGAPAIKAAVLAKLHPDLKLDGKSSDYIDARFDAAIESASSTAAGKARAAAGTGTEHKDGEPLDAEKARAQARKDAQDAWQKPLTAVKA
jgi:hypothetical protein